MTMLEAVVWCFGILVGGTTICSVARSFSKASAVVDLVRAELRTIIENQDEARHDRQMEWEKNNERESDPQNR